MFKKIIFIFIFLFLTIGFVGAFEVPSEFESVADTINYNSYTYTNNYDDDDNGQVIEVLSYEEYKEKYLSDYENYSLTMNDDGTFDFFYFGDDVHSGIGKDYGDLTVLFWNKDASVSDDNLKELIAECDALNEDIDEDI